RLPALARPGVVAGEVHGGDGARGEVLPADEPAVEPGGGRDRGGAQAQPRGPRQGGAGGPPPGGRPGGALAVRRARGGGRGARPRGGGGGGRRARRPGW